MLPQSSFPVIDSVWLSLNGITYQNNSLVTLEDIGENDTALLCITNQTTCCRPLNTGEKGFSIRNWIFPNDTKVPSSSVNGTQWNFYRERGQMVVYLYRRRCGVDGIYYCKIPDSLNVTQTIYIGVYTATTGELYLHSFSAVVIVILLCTSITLVAYNSCYKSVTPKSAFFYTE